LPGGRSATLTLGEWVEEYLAAYQGERVKAIEGRVIVDDQNRGGMCGS
jgi:hypothetical protein